MGLRKNHLNEVSAALIFLAIINYSAAARPRVVCPLLTPADKLVSISAANITKFIKGRSIAPGRAYVGNEPFTESFNTNGKYTLFYNEPAPGRIEGSYKIVGTSYCVITNKQVCYGIKQGKKGEYYRITLPRKELECPLLINRLGGE